MAGFWEGLFGGIVADGGGFVVDGDFALFGGFYLDGGWREVVMGGGFPMAGCGALTYEGVGDEEFYGVASLLGFFDAVY